MIYTGRWYSAWQARKAGNYGFQQVRISVSAPRYWPGPHPSIQELAPYGLMELDDQKFEQAYDRRLTRHGVDQIDRLLGELVRSYAPKPIVLCCYEDVSNDKPNGYQSCHRRLFANWWEDQTGDRIDEYPFAGNRR